MAGVLIFNEANDDFFGTINHFIKYPLASTSFDIYIITENKCQDDVAKLANKETSSVNLLTCSTQLNLE